MPAAQFWLHLSSLPTDVFAGIILKRAVKEKTQSVITLQVLQGALWIVSCSITWQTLIRNINNCKNPLPWNYVGWPLGTSDVRILILTDVCFLSWLAVSGDSQLYTRLTFITIMREIIREEEIIYKIHITTGHLLCFFWIF